MKQILMIEVSQKGEDSAMGFESFAPNLGKEIHTRRHWR
jgi:hypothetical protein